MKKSTGVRQRTIVYFDISGTHEYVHFPIHLQDQAERGYEWRTWEKLDIVLWDPDTT